MNLGNLLDFGTNFSQTPPQKKRRGDISKDGVVSMTQIRNATFHELVPMQTVRAGLGDSRLRVGVRLGCSSTGKSVP